MDREHPIPQEVSTYEFRLVGDMTIKQFMQVASGALISLLLYSTNIAPYVKWPLILISFLSGIALAFFPIQDRPLSKWIILFVKAIYSPTLYVWDKNASLHQFFQPEENDITEVNPLPDLPPPPIVSQQIISDSGNTIPEAEEAKLDQTEEAFLAKLNSHFSAPDGGVSGTSGTPSNTANINDVSTSVPLNQAVKVEPSKNIELDSANAETSENKSYKEDVISPMTSSQSDDTGKAAIFTPDAAPPSPPTRPNIVVGQIVDSEGKLISGAILEIIDANGRSVRALRSNNLGHFMIVTPLVDGSYKITVEKEGYEFEPVTFEAIDRIIPPIAIWAKVSSQPQQVDQNNHERVTLNPVGQESPTDQIEETTQIGTNPPDNNWVEKVKESLPELQNQQDTVLNTVETVAEEQPVSGNLYNAPEPNKPAS